MNTDNTADLLRYDEPGKPKLPSGLNVLTILSFVGCALQLITSVFGFFSAQSTYEGKDKLIEQMNSGNMPSWAKSMMGDPAHLEEMITKSFENRIPIVLLSLVAIGLCFVGALQMRKLKKQGFLLYTIGELLPFLTLFLFIGSFAFSGIGFYSSGVIALLFIFLYFLQRSKMVN